MARKMRKRTRTCYNKKEFKQAIEDLQERGYVLKSKDKRSAVLVKQREKKHHGLIAILTIWWSFGLINILYAMLPKKKDDEVTLILQK